MLSDNDKNILDAIFNKQDSEIALNNFESEKGIESEQALSMEVKQLEHDGLLLAANENWDKAMDSFTMAINLQPSYASAYNNRAQVLRILQRTEEALQDINMAIKFGSPAVLKQAYTQRAIIQKASGNVAEAEEDFRKGAQYGNEFSKIIVKCNPYAKLCNMIVSEAMQKYQAELYS